MSLIATFLVVHRRECKRRRKQEKAYLAFLRTENDRSESLVLSNTMSDPASSSAQEMGHYQKNHLENIVKEGDVQEVPQQVPWPNPYKKRILALPCGPIEEAEAKSESELSEDLPRFGRAAEGAENQNTATETVKEEEKIEEAQATQSPTTTSTLQIENQLTPVDGIGHKASQVNVTYSVAIEKVEDARCSPENPQEMTISIPGVPIQKSSDCSSFSSAQVSQNLEAQEVREKEASDIENDLRADISSLKRGTLSPTAESQEIINEPPDDSQAQKNFLPLETVVELGTPKEDNLSESSIVYVEHSNSPNMESKVALQDPESLSTSRWGSFGRKFISFFTQSKPESTLFEEEQPELGAEKDFELIEKHQK